MSMGKSMSEICNSDISETFVRAALAPSLDTHEERPPVSDDFVIHVNKSIETLNKINEAEKNLVPILLQLCSEHILSDESSKPHCWSSSSHIDKAEQILRTFEQQHQKSVTDLLSENECVMFKKILTELQPKLQKFIMNPSSVASLTWLTGHLTRDSITHVVPLLIPHVLNLTDCWIPYYKVWGCNLSHHIVEKSPATELIFFGRAELLSDAMFRMLTNTETLVVKASSEPLLTLTRVRHKDTSDTCPGVPGPGDHLMKELITRLELCSDSDKRIVFTDMMERTVNILGIGVARWLSRICHLTSSMLEMSPPTSLFRIVTQLTQLCPECVARDMSVLLPSLVKYLYHMSWRDDVSDNVNVTLANVCLDHVMGCDPAQARLLCHDLASVKHVNKTFDKTIQKLLAL